MKIEIKGPAQRLSIYLGERDAYHGKPFYEAIVYRLREERFAGVTVFRGIEGFGPHSQVIHTASILRLSSDLPILIEVVDKETEIKRAIEIIETMLDESLCGVLVTLENIEVIRYHP